MTRPAEARRNARRAETGRSRTPMGRPAKRASTGRVAQARAPPIPAVRPRYKTWFVCCWGRYKKREPRERGVVLACEDDKIKLASEWKTSDSNIPPNACKLPALVWLALPCGARGSQADETCNLAHVHTHPYFTKADRGTVCHTKEIDERRAIQYNQAGMKFSSLDTSGLNAKYVDGFLGVSDRSCVKKSQSISIILPRQVSTIEGSCTPPPLPHTRWSAP